MIDTSRVAPAITTDAVTDAGSFFRSVAANGSPSAFLFGATSAFDNQVNFDNQFASDFSNTGVYRFSALQIEGNPTFVTRDGANRIGLIAQTDITSSSLGGNVNLSGLDSLFLGTVSGSISLSDRFSFTKADGSAFKLIQLYARNGSVNFGSSMNLKDANLSLYAQQNVTIDSTASILANSAILTGLGATTINGSLSAHFAQVYAGTNLVVNGSIAAETIYGFGGTGTISGSFSGRDVSLQTGGDLTLTSAGSLSSADKLTVVTGGALNLAGSTTDLEDASSSSKTYTLQAGTDLNLSGVLTASYTLNASGRTANLSNLVTGKTVNFTLTDDFNMVNPGKINSNDLTITTGGAINLGAVNNTSGIVLKSGGNIKLPSGAIAFNGPVTTKNLTAIGTTLTAKAPVTGQQLTLNASVDFISAVGGNLTGTGPGSSLLITAANLVTLSGLTTGNNITVTSGTGGNAGVLAINGAIQAQSSLTANAPATTLNAVVSGKDASFNSGTVFAMTGVGGFNLTGDATIAASRTLTLDGPITTLGNLTLNGLATINANSSISSQDVTVAGTNVTFAGGISAKHFTVNNQGDLLLSGTGSLTASDVVSLTARNGVTLNGASSGKSFLISAGKDLTTNAVMQTPGSFVATTRNAYINQSLNADNATFNVVTDFELSPTGAITTGHDINITSSGRDITLSAATNSGKLNLTALKGNVTMDGNAQAQAMTITGKKAFIGGSLNSTGDLNFAMSQDFILKTPGSLTTNGNIIIAGQGITLGGSSTGNTYKLTGTKDLTVDGTVGAQDFQATAASAIFNSTLLSAKNIALTLNGDLTTGASSNLSAASGFTGTATGSAYLSGALTAPTIALTATKDLFVNNGSRLQASRSLNLSGATATIAGIVNSPTVSITGTNGITFDAATGYLSADNVTLNSPTGILTLASATNGTGGVDAARLQSLNATADSVILLSSFALAPSSSNLTIGSGGVTATGFDVSGFDKITLNSSSYLGRDLSVNTLTFNVKGDLILTGNLYAAQKATTSGGVVIVDGMVGGGDILATKITAGGSSAASLTATSLLTLGAEGIVSGSTVGTKSINAPSIKWGTGGVALGGAAGTAALAPGAASSLDVTTSALAIGANNTDLKSVELSGGDADPTRNDAGGNGGSFSVTTTGAITVDAPITATTGLNSKSGTSGGNGGNVNLTANGAVTVNSKIETSSNDGGRRASAKGGKITLTSKATTNSGITVGSSAQLLALLSNAAPGPGGTIKFSSSGGDINMSGTAKADRGTIDIQNSGKLGKVNLTNSTLSADVVKAGALGSNGTLTVNGGTLSADSALKLYAGGSSGTILFAGNVTLNGNSVKTIAANTVTIANGKVVTIGGPLPANVFTNTPNYTGFGGNNSTSGTFAGTGAATKPLLLAPGY